MASVSAAGTAARVSAGWATAATVSAGSTGPASAESAGAWAAAKGTADDRPSASASARAAERTTTSSKIPPAGGRIVVRRYVYYPTHSPRNNDAGPRARPPGPGPRRRRVPDVRGLPQDHQPEGAHPARPVRGLRTGAGR